MHIAIKMESTMSLKNTPHLNDDEMKRILAEEEVGVLCLSEHDKPYAVPISYAYLNGKIVFHCALQGRKLDILRQNNQATLVVFRHPDRVVPHAEGRCEYRFESVLVFGYARIVEDVSERLQLLRQFQEYFYARLHIIDPKPLTEQAAKTCGCVEITIEEMTGRRRDHSLE